MFPVHGVELELVGGHQVVLVFVLSLVLILQAGGDVHMYLPPATSRVINIRLDAGQEESAEADSGTGTRGTDRLPQIIEELLKPMGLGHIVCSTDGTL